MKDFLKFTFATVTGIILVTVIFFFLSIITLFGIIASSEKEVVVRENSIMRLKLSGTIEERSTENPLAVLFGNSYESMGLNDILSSIKKAKEDNKIKGIYIETGTFYGVAPASLEEIRNALVDFKESGKFIVAYGDNYTQKEYYLCSVADKIVLNPQGHIEWIGMSSQPVFYKELLEKLGIKMQIFKVGTYKSAVEPFTETKMSDANREQVTAFLNSIWGKILSDVSTSRNISIDSLNAYANRMLSLEESEEMVKCGLADTLLYIDGMKSYLKQLAGIDNDQSLNTLSLSDMVSVKKNVPKNKSGNIIAVYYACGEITGAYSGMTPGKEEGIVSAQVIKDLSQLREDKNVRAVVLRVNSPGGSAFASEQIWNEVMKLKENKPVIVSMGDVAASGGYYISCAADYIFAEPTTLTGSIGIFGIIPDMQGLLTDKLGLHFDAVKTNKFADIGNTSRPMNNEERRIIQNTINRGYELFVTRCADGRGMTNEEIKRIAEGRVWTGSMAKEHNLIDELGGLEEAIQVAVNKAEINEYTVLSYPKQEGFLSNILNQSKSNYINGHIKNNLGEHYKYFNVIRNIEHIDHIQAHIGFDPNVQL